MSQIAARGEGAATPLVLVAEDSRVVRSILRRQLEPHGFRVVEAGDGEQVVAMCRRERPDVVLLDVEMPRMDGYGVLASIRDGPGMAGVPIVLVTARATTEDVVEGLGLGAHDYLRKPFEPSELLARVHAALRLRNTELDVMSRTDSLTRLHNRRHLEERLEELASLLRRHGGELAVLLVDVDRFKRINDEHGHATGDAVLRTLAHRLRGGIRAEDVPGRWGGEEFLVLLPSTGPQGAAATAERIRSAVAAEPFALGGGELAVTVSVGAASGVDGGWERLVRRADAALYAAKAAGRDRVVSADEPSPLASA